MGRYVLQCSDDSHKAGTTVEAGLPNIRGRVTYISSDGENDTLYPDTGALYWANHEHTTMTQTINNGKAKRDIVIDASRSNPIYGRSDTVQPPARIVNVWKRVS